MPRRNRKKVVPSASTATPRAGNANNSATYGTTPAATAAGTPNVSPIFQINEADLLAVKVTESHGKKAKTKQEHRNRIRQIIDFIKREYPEYGRNGGIVPIPADKLNDPIFYAHKNTEDLCYSMLPLQLMKAFLARNKYKENGKLCSLTNLRKFKDAILFGAKQADEPLQPGLSEALTDFLSKFKKENVVAKGRGETDEKNSDPISFALYGNLTKWFVLAGDIFGWLYTTIQWNCMARPASIEKLGIRNLLAGASDSFKILYDDSKADNAGEHVTPKNIYANPYCPYICPFTSLGIWLMLMEDTFTDDSDSIFLRSGNIGSATHTYANHLKEIVKAHASTVAKFCRPDRAKPHGVRKGSATHATSGSINPPPLPAVAKRAEWSQGTVFDIYLLFAEPGDHYLGRILAGLDVNSLSFGVLPPHFVNSEDEEVTKAIDMCFGNILRAHEHRNAGLRGILSLLLASVVYHMDNFVEPIVQNDPSHPFAALKRDVLLGLRDKVTLEPTDTVPRGTGLPTHIIHAKTMVDIQDKVKSLESMVRTMKTTVSESVNEVMERRAVDGGNTTPQYLSQELEKHFGNMTSTMESEMEKIVKAISTINVGDQRCPPTIPIANTQHGHRTFTYNGRSDWQVPENWQFPEKIKRGPGWRLWLRGNAEVRPFRELSESYLPTKRLKSKLKLEWRPIFKLMERAPGFVPPAIGEIPSDEFVNNSYQICTEYLKTRVQYVFSNEASKHEHLTVSTWSKKTTWSSIDKHGTEQDRLNNDAFHPVRNAKHKDQRKKKRCMTDEEKEARRNRRKQNNNALMETLDLNGFL